MAITISDIQSLRSAMAESGLDNHQKRFRRSKDNYALLVDMINLLDDEAKSLVIDMIRHYEIIKSYEVDIYSILQHLDKLHDCRVYLFPLRCKHHFGTKSGDAIAYEFRSIASAEFPKKFLFEASPFGIKMLNSGLPKYAVDDFIGTGEQFSTMVEDMRQENPDVVITGIACVAALRVGVENVQQSGFRAVVSHVRERAIADYLASNGADPEICYSVYDRIEALLNVSEIDKRGRNNSEGLISLKRTPNNTLPIFWHVGKEGKWPAPFKRT